jgi:hypothetical protein
MHSPWAGLLELIRDLIEYGIVILAGPSLAFRKRRSFFLAFHLSNGFAGPDAIGPRRPLSKQMGLKSSVA